MAGRNTPMVSNALNDVITEVMGMHSRLVAIAGGDESAAYRFDCDGQGYIARLSGSRSGFDKDRLIQQRYGAALPIPVIRTVVPVQGEGWLCVSDRAMGETLQDAAPEDVDGSAEAVAAVLNTIGAIEMAEAGGFGRLDGDGKAAFASWRGFLLSVADRAHYDWAPYADWIGGNTLAALLKRLETLAVQCPEQAHLVHGDFGSNNVLVASGKVTAVIDWSEALVGDPLYDVAIIVFWRSWLDCMERQAWFYEKRAPAALGDQSVLQCYMLSIGLQQLFEAAQAGDRQVFDWALARCMGIAG